MTVYIVMTVSQIVLASSSLLYSWFQHNAYTSKHKVLMESYKAIQDSNENDINALDGWYLFALRQKITVGSRYLFPGVFYLLISLGFSAYFLWGSSFAFKDFFDFKALNAMPIDYCTNTEVSSLIMHNDVLAIHLGVSLLILCY